MNECTPIYEGIIDELIIDPEFQTLFPRLNDEDFAGLEESLCKFGCLSPLITWNNILIDGHNRFEIIQKHGISSQLVDAGGDLRLGAPPPGSEGWRIARESDVAFLKNTALATSGGRFQFVVIDGVRYAHIVDPRTGLGMTGLQTVHVMAPTAMEADALATAVILLGKEKGQALIDTMPKVSMEFVEL